MDDTKTKVTEAEYKSIVKIEPLPPTDPDTIQELIQRIAEQLSYIKNNISKIDTPSPSSVAVAKIIKYIHRKLEEMNQNLVELCQEIKVQRELVIENEAGLPTEIIPSDEDPSAGIQLIASIVELKSEAEDMNMDDEETTISTLLVCPTCCEVYENETDLQAHQLDKHPVEILPTVGKRKKKAPATKRTQKSQPLSQAKLYNCTKCPTLPKFTVYQEYMEHLRLHFATELQTKFEKEEAEPMLPDSAHPHPQLPPEQMTPRKRSRKSKHTPIIDPELSEPTEFSPLALLPSSNSVPVRPTPAAVHEPVILSLPKKSNRYYAGPAIPVPAPEPDSPPPKSSKSKSKSKKAKRNQPSASEAIANGRAFAAQAAAAASASRKQKYPITSCEICNKTFTRPETLKNHMLIHTGEKPFSCHICKKSFNRRCNMIAHLKNLHSYD